MEGEPQTPEIVTDTAFLIGRHRYAYRTGYKAVIIGVKMVAKQGIISRPCYHIQFEDGKEDYVPVSEVINGNYEIVG